MDLKKELMEAMLKKYNKAVLTKSETAVELGIGLSTLSKRMSEGMGCPNYIKNGTTGATRVFFPIAEIAEFLSGTTKVQ